MTPQKTQDFWLFNSVFSNNPVMTPQKTQDLWLFNPVFSNNPAMTPQKTQDFWLTPSFQTILRWPLKRPKIFD